MAVNGCMESLASVLNVCQELDEEALDDEGLDGEM